MTTTFRRQLTRLKRGIIAAWIINILVLTLTVEAAAIYIFLGSDSSNAEIVSFLRVSIPISVIIAFLGTAIASRSASKMVMGAAGGDCVLIDAGVPYDVVQECSIAAGVPMPEVYVARGTKVANAWAVSDSKGSRVVITDGLLNMMTRTELQGVVAHEIGHIASGDSKAMTTLTGLTAVTGIIAGSVSRSFRSNNNNNSGNNSAAVLLIIFAFFFLLFAPLISRMSRMWMSRTRESNADMLSVKYTNNPDALMSALMKLADSDKSIDPGQAAALDARAGYLAFHAPHLKGLDAGMSTHPPIEKRIEALRSVGGMAIPRRSRTLGVRRPSDWGGHGSGYRESRRY